MSLLHPSQTTRRLLKIASLGLAGLLAGLLAGCSSDPVAQLTYPHNDTDWQTVSTYASETAPLPPHGSGHTLRTRPCVAAPCELRVATTHPSHHQTSSLAPEN